MAKVSISEVRRLVLPIETAVDALLQLDLDRCGGLSSATLVDAQVESEPEPGLVLTVKWPSTGLVERRKYALPMMAAAIINYCWQSRIPLPRHGAKKLEIVPEGFAFTIETTSQVPRRHDPVPARPAPKAAVKPDDQPEEKSEQIAEAAAAQPSEA